MGRETKTITAEKGKKGENALYSIADQIANILYKKTLADCLGEKQGLSCSKFNCPGHLKLIISIEKSIYDMSKAQHYTVLNLDKYAGYIKSMIQHGKKQGYSIVLINN